MHVHIDFETRSCLDIRRVGGYKYSLDCKILCVCFAIDDGPVKLWAPPIPGQELISDGIDEGIDELFEAVRQGATVYAHNAAFEYAVWNNHCQALLGWPEISDDKWRCTAAKAASLGLPRSLEGAAKAIGLDVEKDKAGHRIMLQLAKPRKPTKNNPNIWHNDPVKFEKLYEYCRTDVEVEREIQNRLGDLPPQEQLLWQVDQEINRRGIPIDLDNAKHALATFENLSKLLTRQLTEITNGIVSSAGQIEKIISWLSIKGFKIGGLTSAHVKEALARDDLDDDVRKVLEIRQALSKSSVKKYQAMLDRTGSDGRLRESHLYHGALTGRWAGKGVQIQNFPRGSVSCPKEVSRLISLFQFEDPEILDLVSEHSVSDILSSCLRGMIKATGERQFFVCDYASIEARVLAWLAGEEEILQDFRDGVDAYKRMASKIYDVHIDAVTSDQRFFGKTSVLGLGYGLGPVAFQRTLESFGIEFDDLVESEKYGRQVSELCLRIVDIYRRSNKKIVKWWRQLDDAAKRTIQSGKPDSAGKITFSMQGDFLMARLPSNRCIAYSNAEVASVEVEFGDKTSIVDQVQFKGVSAQSYKWETQSTYGGNWAQHMTQAVSRDFLADAILRISECPAVEIVAHVHDEIVAEVIDPESCSLEQFESMMSELPEWGEGCPISCEGFHSERYRK